MNPAAHLARRQQLGCLIRLAEGFRSILPNLEFAVCGLDRQGKLPSWITDRRVDEINDATNREWAEQGARSHILLGVLGSHTVLPGSLSGGLITRTRNSPLVISIISQLILLNWSMSVKFYLSDVAL